MVPEDAQVLRRAREALLAKASRSSRTLVLVTDAQGFTVWLSPAFEVVFGYTLEDIGGRYPGQVLNGRATNAEAAGAILRAVREGRPIETRILCYKKSGAAIWLDLEILPFGDEAACLGGFVYLSRPEPAEASLGCRERTPEGECQYPQPAAPPAEVQRAKENLAECLMSAYPYRVLVAEDHPINLKLVVALLQAAGCEAQCAGNGEQALTALDEADFDLIVMDSQMPIMTGIEAIAVIRSREDWKRCIPILSLTAHAMKGAEEYHTSAGADLYMSKPLRSDCFIGAVRSLAQRGRDLRQKNAGE